MGKCCKRKKCCKYIFVKGATGPTGPAGGTGIGSNYKFYIDFLTLGKALL